MIVCWVKPNGEYYYKFVKGTYTNYYIGFKNSYDHEVILIIKNPYLGYSKRVNYTRFYLKRLLRWLYKKI